MISTQKQRTWRIPRPLLEDYIGFSVLAWIGFVVVVTGVILGVNYWGEITVSVWEQAQSASVWYAGGVSGYVLFTSLPLCITHGRTRKDFAIEATIFAILLSFALAVLIVVGYLLERGLYSLNGWTHELSNDHLYSSASEIPMIFVEHYLGLLVWSAVGGFVGAAIYREKDNGYFALIPALIPLVLVDIGVGSSTSLVSGLFERFGPDFSGSLPAAVALGLSAFSLSLAMAWSIIRNSPVRSKTG